MTAVMSCWTHYPLSVSCVSLLPPLKGTVSSLETAVSLCLCKHSMTKPYDNHKYILEDLIVFKYQNDVVLPNGGRSLTGTFLRDG